MRPMPMNSNLRRPCLSTVATAPSVATSLNTPTATEATGADARRVEDGSGVIQDRRLARKLLEQHDTNARGQRPPVAPVPQPRRRIAA